MKTSLTFKSLFDQEEYERALLLLGKDTNNHETVRGVMEGTKIKIMDVLKSIRPQGDIVLETGSSPATVNWAWFVKRMIWFNHPDYLLPTSRSENIKAIHLKETIALILSKNIA